MTEFINPPAPEQVTLVDPSEGNETDTTLKFGATTFGHGKAFLLGDQPPGGKMQTEAKVYKSWIHLQQRTFLVEAVPYHRIASQLQALPDSGSTATPDHAKLQAFRAPSGHYQLPPARVALAASGSKARFSLIPGHLKTGLQTDSEPRTARGSAPALVLDYVAVIAAQTNMVFQGDTTYYVSGEYSLYGTTTIEGGAVIKMDSSGQLDIDSAGSINCKTGPYRPGIFTSVNDNSVGEPFGSGSPVVGDVNYFLNIYCPTSVLSNLRMNYASGTMQSSEDLDIWDCQFTPVDQVVTTARNVGLHNVLIRGIWDDPVIGAWNQSYAENVTLDGGDTLEADAETNCIEVSEGGSGTDFTPTGGASVYTNSVYPDRLR